MFKETRKAPPHVGAIPLPKWMPGSYSTVALIDTGLSADRFENAVVIPGINLSGEGRADDTADRNGHGTAVASTIFQLAPQAALVPIKLLGDCGYLRLPDQLEVAFEWVLDHHTSLGIGVVCATFADGSHSTNDQPHRGSRLQTLIAALRIAGVVTVAPAGNRYQQNRIWGKQGMAWPAILREVISVGAITHVNKLPCLSPETQRLHAVAGTGCYTTVFVKPNAPGDTSGAAAVVAGCLAALKSTYPDATVDELVEQLMFYHCDAPDDHFLSWPALDVPEITRISPLSSCLGRNMGAI